MIYALGIIAELVYMNQQLDVHTFNPTIVIHRSLHTSAMYIPIMITFRNQSTESKYVYNNKQCGGDCVRQFSIEGYVEKIEPDPSLPEVSEIVDGIQIDIYIQLRTIDHIGTAYEYFTSQLYRSCCLTRTQADDPNDRILLEFTDLEFSRPARIYNITIFNDYLFLQPSTCVERVRSQVGNITLQDGVSYYFASKGFNELLNNGVSEANATQYAIAIDGLEQNYTTPFTFTKVSGTDVQISVERSIVYGRERKRPKYNVVIQNMLINDTGYYYHYQHMCVNFYLMDHLQVKVLVDDHSITIDTFPVDADSPTMNYTTGYICGGNITLKPLAYYNTDNETELKQLCELNNRQDRNHWFLFQKCSEYVFVEEYLVHLCAVMCLLCCIWGVSSVIHSLYVIRIPFKDNYGAYVLGITIAAVSLFNGILIFVLEGLLIVALPGITLFLYSMYSYLITTRLREQYSKDQLRRLTKKKVTVGFIMSFIAAYAITVLISIGNVIMVIVDVFQMLQFFKLPTDEIEKFWGMQPALYIIHTYDILFDISYGIVIPFVIFYYGMQFLTRQPRILARLPDKRDDDNNFVLDWKNFLFKTLLALLTIVQNYIGQMMSTFLAVIFNLEVSPQPLQVIFCVITSTYMYTFSKFDMFRQWGICFYKVFIMVSADIAAFVLNIVDLLWTFLSLFIGIHAVCKGKKEGLSDLRRVEYVNTVIWFFKTLCYAVLQIIISLLKVVIFLLYPVFLFFAEFMPPFNFLIQAVGIIPHQVEMSNIQNDIVTESYLSVFIRFMLYASTFILMSLLIIVQQDLTAWYQCQYFLLCFLLIFIQRALSGNKLKCYKLVTPNRQNYHFYPFQRRLARYLQSMLQVCYKHNNFRRATMQFQNISSNYEHEHSYVEDYLIEQIINCYNFIPGIGPLLSVFASYLNSPSLSTGGQALYSVQYFLNIIQFGSAITCLIIYNSKSYFYLIPFVIYFVCQCLDNYDEVVELTNRSGIEIQYVFRCVCIENFARKNRSMQQYAKRKLQINSATINAILDSSDNGDVKQLQQLQQNKLRNAQLETEIQHAKQTGDTIKLKELTNEQECIQMRINNVSVRDFGTSDEGPSGVQQKEVVVASEKDAVVAQDQYQRIDKNIDFFNIQYHVFGHSHKTLERLSSNLLTSTQSSQTTHSNQSDDSSSQARWQPIDTNTWGNRAWAGNSETDANTTDV